MVTRNTILRYNWGNQHLKDALAKIYEVKYWGPGYTETEGFPTSRIDRVFTKTGFFPDILFLFFPARTLEPRHDLAGISYGDWWGPKVMYDTDSQRHIEARARFVNDKGIQLLLLGNNDRFVNVHQVLCPDCNVCWQPFGINLNLYQNLNLERDIEILSLGMVNEHYPMRRMLIKSFINHFGNIFQWRTDHKIVRQNYIERLNRAKIFVTANDKANGLFMKCFEAMACGCLLVCQHNSLFGKLGFTHGEHVLLYKDLGEARELVKYYLNHPIERTEIAEKGRGEVQKHSWEVRAELIKERIEEIGLR